MPELPCKTVADIAEDRTKTIQGGVQYCWPAVRTFGWAERSHQREDGASSRAVVPVGYLVVVEADRLLRGQTRHTETKKRADVRGPSGGQKRCAQTHTVHTLTEDHEPSEAV